MWRRFQFVGAFFFLQSLQRSSEEDSVNVFADEETETQVGIPGLVQSCVLGARVHDMKAGVHDIS